jgi:hypothetical protein
VPTTNSPEDWGSFWSLTGLKILKTNYFLESGIITQLDQGHETSAPTGKHKEKIVHQKYLKQAM